MITYNLTATEKFERMQQQMYIIYPSLGSFYSMCNKRVLPKSSGVTLRLNVVEGSAPIIEYTEEFVGKLSVETFTILISIELFRLLLHHPTTRMQHNRALTVQSSNYICCDSKICNFIMPYDLKDVFPSLGELQAMEPNFNPQEDLFLEKVYAILEKQPKNQQQQQQQQQQQGQGQGDGDGEPQEGDGDEEGKSEKEQESDALKDHFSQKQSQKNSEAWGENELVDAQVSDEVNKRSISSWSDVGNGMTKMILKANELQFDPWSVIKRFATSVFSDFISFTRMRPNRRLPDMTGILPGKRHAMKAKVLFAIDCSGSMAESEIERACGVVNSALKHAETWYCFWDCKCSDFTQKRNKASDFDGLGGGGTNPDCVIKKLEAEKEHFDGLVFITDCYFDWQQPKGKHKIFILHTKDAGQPPEWCKWHLGMDDIQKIHDSRN
jgi:hypothetical protein